MTETEKQKTDKIMQVVFRIAVSVMAVFLPFIFYIVKDSNKQTTEILISLSKIESRQTLYESNYQDLRQDIRDYRMKREKAEDKIENDIDKINDYLFKRNN